MSEKDLVQPVFAIPGEDKKEEIPSMPDCYRYSVDRIDEAATRAVEAGIEALLIFGVPAETDETASRAHAESGTTQRAVRKLADKFPSLTLITDVCLCAFTSHGHCGIVESGRVDNDASLEVLAKTAVSHARAGADMVAPSDMMDGRVRRLRDSLDENGFETVGLLSYSAKFASAFYGPFRDAAGSAPEFGDRKSYQMDPGNRREALKEIELDVDEGADVVMVKPALPYLDVISAARERVEVPVAAYSVSGEYAMIKHSAAAGAGREPELMLETMTSIKRAGADLIITYFARDLAELLK